MQDNLIRIVYNKELDVNLINNIKEHIASKYNKNNLEVKFELDTNLLGGILVYFDKFTIILDEDDSRIKSLAENAIYIESARKLTNEEREQYTDYAIKFFKAPSEIDVVFNVNTNLVGGITVRYNDTELDLTIDKVLNQVFSNI